jgi:hypothetical protein
MRSGNSLPITMSCDPVPRGNLVLVEGAKSMTPTQFMRPKAGYAFYAVESMWNAL